MRDWTSGYVADIDYTYGYYTELNPLRVQLAFLNQGLVCPAFGSACELGFGQGISVNCHASATVTSWCGTDFNPSQAAFAQELATAAGAGARLFDEAFADFAQRTDLPDFDYIGLHGIWSWVSDDNRAVIVDFLRRKLKVGGVLYISYNTQPGWAATLPLRDLLTEHANRMGATGGGIVNRIDGALDFVDKLFAANPQYARANPAVAGRLKGIREQNRHYVAHEYFNRDWQPMAFSAMARWLEPAKLQWACSANPLDAVDEINLTAEQQELLKGMPDAVLRQTARDFCVNQQFRKDYWVKGPRSLSGFDRLEALRALRVVLTQPREDVAFKVSGVLGDATLQEPVFGPILNTLKDHRPRTLGDVEQALQGQSGTPPAHSFAQILQAALLFSATGALSAAQTEANTQQAKPATDRLNAMLMQKSRSSNDFGYLASPVTGGGLPVPRFQQMFIAAMHQGKSQPVEWAQAAWEALKAQNQRLLKSGKAIESEADNLAELTSQAQTFQAKHLPMWQALQVA